MNFRNTLQHEQGAHLTISVRLCTPDELPEGVKECANRKETENYFKNKHFAFFEVKNFINYKQVDDEPIQQVLELLFAQQLEFDVIHFRQLKVTETQVSLQDSLWQHFYEPNNFSILNLNTK